jgi:hypothetical protein
MMKKRIVLGAVMIAALCAGIWFMVSPSLNRQADLNEQGELLDEIMALMPSYFVVNSDIETPINERESVIFEDNDTFESIADELLEPVVVIDEEVVADDAPLLEPLRTILNRCLTSTTIQAGM